MLLAVQATCRITMVHPPHFFVSSQRNFAAGWSYHPLRTSDRLETCSVGSRSMDLRFQRRTRSIQAVPPSRFRSSARLLALRAFVTKGPFAHHHPFIGPVLEDRVFAVS